MSGSRGDDRQPKAIWFIWRLVAHRPGLFALHLTWITLLVYVIPFLPSLAVRQLLDRLTGTTGEGLTVNACILVFLAIGLTRAAAESVAALISTNLMQNAVVLMRRNMFDRVLHRPGARALPASPGEALVRFQSDPDAVSHALDFFADPFGQVFAYVFAGLVLTRIDLFLTVVVVVPAVLVMFLVNLATPKIVEARRARQASLGEVSGLLGEAFAAVTSIKAARAEGHVTARFERLGDERRRASLRDLLVEQLLRSLSGNTATVATGILLFVVAGAARRGDFSAGDVAVFTT
jgi:ATP-binding cassette, subfamily B, bacterial